MTSTGEGRIVALDAMSGDLGPEEAIRALAIALSETPADCRFRAVGDEAVLQPLIGEHCANAGERVILHHASEVIAMDEKPILALRRKRDSSLVRAVEAVREGDAQAAVSCGNTGALMACGALKLRPLEGIDKPALATVFPSPGSAGFVLIDSGANPLARPFNLVDNAILGTDYARIVLGMERPRVGLLSIGTEEGKGNELTVATHKLLKECDPTLNYIGLIEGLQIFENVADVIVCDGFTGNVLLKTCEGLYKMIRGILKSELKANPIRMAGAMLSKGAFNAMKEQLDPDSKGGAPLLGLNGLVVKAHGGSNARAIASALVMSSEVVAHDFGGRVTEDALALREKLSPEPSA